MFVTSDFHYPEINFITREHLDPILLSVLDLLGLSTNQMAYEYLQLLVFFLGAGVLLRVMGVELRRAVLGPCILTGLLCATVGLDPFLLKTHWFPLLLAAVLAYRSSSSFVSLLTSVLLATIWCWTAGTLAVFGLLVVFLCSQVANAFVELPCSLNSYSRPILWLFFTVFVLLGLYQMPVYQMPQYPAGAQLAPLSAFTFYSFPFIGPYFEPSPLVFDVYATQLFYAVVKLLVALLVCLAFQRFGDVEEPSERKAKGRQLLSFAVFLLLILGSELLLPEELTTYSLYPTLQRIVPGLAMAPVALLILPIALSIFAVFLATSLRVTSLALLAFISVLVTTFFSIYPWSGVGPKVAHFQSIGKTVSTAERILNSPSWYVTQTFGEWILKEPGQPKRNGGELKRLVKGVDFEVVLEANPLRAESHFAVDGDPRTRWRTGKPQEGGEIFRMKFDRPLKVVRVVLSVKQAYTDFPKGIEVSGGTGGTGRSFVKFPEWHGPLKWSKDGFPYFGKQSDVTIDFPKEELVDILQFRQIGKGEIFDWSIYEIELYRF